MMHFRAQRLLAALPDGFLDPTLEADVRVHAVSCAQCRHALADMELTEALLRQIPARIQPLEWSPAAYQRLSSLARWSDEPDHYHDPDRWRLPMLGVAGLVTIWILAASVGYFAPVIHGPGQFVTLASETMPANSTYHATGWRTARF